MALDIKSLKKYFIREIEKDDNPFIPDKERTQIRLLPSWDNHSPERVFKKIGYHEIGEKKILCPKEITNNPCPICEEYRARRRDNYALAEQYKVIKRFFWNIIVREEDEKGIRKYGCGTQLMWRIYDFFFRELHKDITDPEDGHDIFIVKKQKSGLPNYTDSYVIKDPSFVGYDWEGELYDLDYDFTPDTYEELKEVLVSIWNLRK